MHAPSQSLPIHSQQVQHPRESTPLCGSFACWRFQCHWPWWPWRPPWARAGFRHSRATSLRSHPHLLARAVGFLRVLFLAGLAGTPLFGWLMLVAWRKKSRRPGVERGFSVGLSCLVTLLGLEIGETVWRVWMHRLPRLPTAFAASPPGEYRIVVLGGSSALESHTGRGYRSVRSSPGSCKKQSLLADLSVRSSRGWAIPSKSSISSWPASGRDPTR